MIEVILVGEGQTEESLARDILAPLFWDRRIFIRARLIRTSAMGRGGALSWPRVKRYLRNSLRERHDTFVTTFFDLYGLDAEFPGQAEATGIRDPLQRAEVIEARFAAAIVDEAGCRADRFLPHVQPDEFESLLFSGVEVLPEVYSEWQAFLEPLQRARREAGSPEHINDGADTHPAIRLQKLLRPRYEKVLHGPAITRKIGMERIRAECVHFAAWLSRIEALAPLESE